MKTIGGITLSPYRIERPDRDIDISGRLVDLAGADPMYEITCGAKTIEDGKTMELSINLNTTAVVQLPHDLLRDNHSNAGGAVSALVLERIVAEMVAGLLTQVPDTVTAQVTDLVNDYVADLPQSNS